MRERRTDAEKAERRREYQRAWRARRRAVSVEEAGELPTQMLPTRRPNGPVPPTDLLEQLETLRGRIRSRIGDINVLLTSLQQEKEALRASLGAEHGPEDERPAHRDPWRDAP